MRFKLEMPHSVEEKLDRLAVLMLFTLGIAVLALGLAARNAN